MAGELYVRQKIMRSSDFRLRLDAASFYVTRFALTMVRDKLPYDFRYTTILNSSYDGNRATDEVIFPEDNNVIHNDLDAKEVVNLLCRDQRVPQWIDISVAFRGRKHTHLELICCGRYHSEDDRLTYFDQGTQPFGIKSPNLPRGHTDGKLFRLPREKEYFERIYKHHKKQAEQVAAPDS
ncbi:hypothetical protein HW115_18875 [Verrucomicrobiaceae bacterium N1E253]|uniref:Uncharacterized protein n=1 Tax=Oceaniferula marina TaxID=2748318 RepID=A0A851GKM1_9BACT|nr:hypothetical protein [Oceaniferula marina]NWK57689.1 hypothetical protein [Oceaniferula marina]